MVIQNIFVGILIIAAGVLSLKFNYQLVNMIGRDNVFERHLGPGTTYPVFKIISLITVFAGTLVVLGIHGTVGEFLLAPLINLFRR